MSVVLEQTDFAIQIRGFWSSADTSPELVPKHTDYRGLDPFVGFDVDYRDQSAGRNHQHHDPWRVSPGRGHSGR